MPNDSLKAFAKLRRKLEAEKTKLEARLSEIAEALGSSAATPEAAPVRRARKASNAMSLKDAILQATAKKPLSKHDILDAVQTLGYRFNTVNPLNSIGVILYGKKPKFKNEDGLFSAA